MRFSSPFHAVLIVATAAFLLSLPACGDDTEARIGFSADVLDSDVYPHVRMTWESPTLFGRQQQTAEVDKRHSRVGPFQTAQSGTLHVRFQLLNGDSPSSTTGSLDLPLKRDWGWSVGFMVSSTSLEGCWGCMDVIPYDIDPAFGYQPDVKLWVVLSGNRIKNPVIY